MGVGEDKGHRFLYSPLLVTHHFAICITVCGSSRATAQGILESLFSIRTVWFTIGSQSHFFCQPKWLECEAANGCNFSY